jgi:Flp pilus assembly protein TadD/TolB-like protein
MSMKKITALLGAICCATALAAQILVLPLKVDTQNHTSFQWLGKALAYYLLSGLSLNDVPVIGHEESQLVLNRNQVRFPFDITKATAITLAGENRADRLVAGEILYSGKSSSQIAIKVFLIDVKKRQQKHLPMLKGNLKNIYQIQAELLREVLKVLAPEKAETRFPDLNLALPDYEKFIKSLLVTDSGKKLELLQSVRETRGPSDFLNIELAKVRLEKNDLAGSEAALKLVRDDSLFRYQKEFLSALVNLAYGYSDIALNQFIRLQRQNIYAVATNNNLGAIYMQRGDPGTAEKCLQYALYLKKDPEIFSNLVILYHSIGQSGRAMEELNRALLLFPGDEILLKQFSFFLAASEYRDMLVQAFRNLLPPPQGEEALPMQPLLKNPFLINHGASVDADGNPFFIEARSLFLENDFPGAMQKVEEAMEVNPFQNETHHLLAMLFLQKRNYAQAEIYAQSAIFLKENPDNFLLLVKIHQTGKDGEKARQAMARGLRRFPQNPELLELKKRGL